MQSLQGQVNMTHGLVIDNKLVDKKVQISILAKNPNIDYEMILEQYSPNYDNAGEDVVERLDRLASQIDANEYINGDIPGSLNQEIAGYLDILGVDYWYFTMLCILNDE